MKVFDVANGLKSKHDQIAAQFINEFENNLPNTFMNVTDSTNKFKRRLKFSSLKTLLHRFDVNIAIKD